MPLKCVGFVKPRFRSESWFSLCNWLHTSWG